MKTVLIVEDQPSNMQAFCYLLTLQGYKVVEASTGREAIDAANRATGPIDLILCDLALPDLPGTKIARKVLQSQPNAAVLIVSGTPPTVWSNSEMEDFAALPAERTDFLEKPFQASALQAKIEDLLAEPSQVRRAYQPLPRKKLPYRVISPISGRNAVTSAEDEVSGRPPVGGGNSP